MNMADEKTIRDFFTQEVPSLKIPPDFFRNPTPDPLLQMYYYMCDIIFDLHEREFTDKSGQPSRAVLVIKVYQYLNGLFGDILEGEAVFSYKDMLLPDIKRTRYFLVQLVKFYKFKCERQVEIDNVTSELEERRRDVETEKAFEQNIYDQLERERQSLEVVQQKRAEVDAKQCALQREVKGHRECSEEQKNEFASKGTKEKELEDKLAEAQLLITEAQEKSRRLEQNIVTSPDRISRDIETMEEELKALNIKHTESLKELRKLERDVGDQTQSKQFLEHFDGALKHLESMQNAASEHRRSYDDTLQSLRDVESSARSLQQRITDQRAHNEALLRQLNDQNRSEKQKVEMLIQEKLALENDLKSLSERCSKANKESRQMQADLKHRNIELQTIGEKFDSAVNRLKHHVKLIEDKVNSEEAILKSVYSKAKMLCKINSVA